MNEWLEISTYKLCHKSGPIGISHSTVSSVTGKPCYRVWRNAFKLFCWWELPVTGKWPKNSADCIQTMHQSHTDGLPNWNQNLRKLGLYMTDLTADCEEMLQMLKPVSMWWHTSFSIPRSHLDARLVKLESPRAASTAS